MLSPEISASSRLVQDAWLSGLAEVIVRSRVATPAAEEGDATHMLYTFVVRITAGAVPACRHIKAISGSSH